MYIFFSLFVFLIGFFVYVKCPRYLIPFYLLYKPFFFPIVISLIPYGNKENFYYYYNSAERPFFLLFTVILFILFASQKKLENNCFCFLRKSKKLFYSSSFLIFYFVIRQYPHLNLYNIYYVLYLLLGCWVFSNKKMFSTDVRIIVKTLEFIIVLQVLFCILNVYGIYLYSATKTDIVGSELIAGTFVRYNHMTNYLTTAYIYISYVYWRKLNVISSSKYIIYTLAVGLIVLFSGARMSVILFGMTFLLFLIMGFRKNIGKSIALFSIISFICIQLFHKFELLSGIERNVNGLSQFFESPIEDNGSTIGLSTYLLFFQFNNPLWGNGIEYRGDNAYVLGTCELQSFQSDAHVAYVIVEYGLICFFLYIFFFFSLYKSMKNYLEPKWERGLLIMFVFFALLTITELGLFDSSLSPFLYICINSKNPPKHILLSKVLSENC